MELFDLSGKVAVVTGGNGGIGFGMARGLAQAGATVAVVGRNEDKNARAVEELIGVGARAAAFAADVTDETAVAGMVEAVTADFGRIDILVNNAGLQIEKTLAESTDDDWQAIVDVNMKGVFLAARAVIPVMARQGGGVILNIGSISGEP